MKTESTDAATQAVHAGEPEPRALGAVVMPVFQTAMYEFSAEPSYDSIPYIRLNNTPNAVAVQRKLACLAGGEDALVTASGMAAISAALLGCLRSGDHLLIQDCLYGGTFTLITQEFPRLGIEYDFIDACAPDTWAPLLRPTTRAIYVEAMTNPLLGVGDLAAVPVFARSHGLVSLIDNTFPSPINFRPAELGYDLSLHSATKYLNGHSDLVAGAVIGRERMVAAARHRLNHLGGSLDPHACFLLHRGIKTLALRMAAHCDNAGAVARTLDAHPAVSQVNYPGLTTHPQHVRASELFDGFSGMLSFELAGGLAAAERFMKRARIPINAPSLGGVESLMTRPVTSSHSGMDPADRARLGISDGLIRMSVGIEAASDLVADINQALDDSGE